MGATVFESIGEALDGADVICATTHAHEPVLRREWLTAGTHVELGRLRPRRAGGRRRHRGRRARRRRVARGGAGAAARAAPDLAGASIRAGVAEIGELVLGTGAGRTAPDQITLYKSVGVAVQDAAAAALVLERAAATGAGTLLSLE